MGVLPKFSISKLRKIQSGLIVTRLSITDALRGRDPYATCTYARPCRLALTNRMRRASSCVSHPFEELSAVTRNFLVLVDAGRCSSSGEAAVGGHPDSFSVERSCLRSFRRDAAPGRLSLGRRSPGIEPTLCSGARRKPAGG